MVRRIAAGVLSVMALSACSSSATTQSEPSSTLRPDALGLVRTTSGQVSYSFPVEHTKSVVALVECTGRGRAEYETATPQGVRVAQLNCPGSVTGDTFTVVKGQTVSFYLDGLGTGIRGVMQLVPQPH